MTALNELPSTPAESPRLRAPLLRPSEAAELLSVRPSWIYEAVRAKRLPCLRVGRHIRFTRESSRRGWPSSSCRRDARSLTVARSRCTRSLAISRAMSERVLCRGWTNSDVREAVLLASDAQREVLRVIALEAPISCREVAGALGRSYASVRATLAAWSRRTGTLGVRDPTTGEPSWPWTYRRRSDGETDYVLDPAVREAILSVTGTA